MKRSHQLIAVTILSLCCIRPANAGDSLDQLLPSPHWVFNHADILGVDEQTREQLEQVFRAAEPDYHAAVAKAEAATKELHESLTADDVDQPVILERMQKLLRAENEVKMIQVRVRTSIISKLSAGQRLKIRQIAARRPEMQKILESKIRRIQQLAEQKKELGQSIGLVQRHMEGIQKVIQSGNLEHASKLLDEVIFRVEGEVKQGSDKEKKEDGEQKGRNRKNRSEKKQKSKAKVSE